MNYNNNNNNNYDDNDNSYNNNSKNNNDANNNNNNKTMTLILNNGANLSLALFCWRLSFSRSIFVSGLPSSSSSSWLQRQEHQRNGGG